MEECYLCGETTGPGDFDVIESEEGSRWVCRTCYGDMKEFLG